MSDDTAWQSPQYGAAPRWVPPPRPGLIPLRPLSFGQLLGTPFQVMRRDVGALFGPAVLIQVVVTLASLGVVGAAGGLLIYRVARASNADRGAILAGGIAAVILAALLAIAISVIGSALLQGIVVVAVANGTLGHRPRAGQLWRATRGRRWALVGFVALLGAAVLVALAALGGIVAALVVAGSANGGGAGAALVVLGVLLGILGSIGFAVLVAWLWTKTSLGASAIMLERLGVRAAIARSWSLSRGGFWRVFGAQILVIMICATATELISVPLNFISRLLLQLAFPTGTPSASASIDRAAAVIAIVSYGVYLLVTIVIGTITSVIEAAAGAVVYIDQRMRREGLDLTLTRYVEDRQSGRPLGDPFATPQFAAPAL